MVTRTAMFGCTFLVVLAAGVGHARAFEIATGAREAAPAVAADPASGQFVVAYLVGDDPAVRTELAFFDSTGMAERTPVRLPLDQRPLVRPSVAFNPDRHEYGTAIAVDQHGEQVVLFQLVTDRGELSGTFQMFDRLANERVQVGDDYGPLRVVYDVVTRSYVVSARFASPGGESALWVQVVSTPQMVISDPVRVTSPCPVGQRSANAVSTSHSPAGEAYVAASACGAQTSLRSLDASGRVLRESIVTPTADRIEEWSAVELLGTGTPGNSARMFAANRLLTVPQDESRRTSSVLSVGPGGTGLAAAPRWHVIDAEDGEIPESTILPAPRLAGIPESDAFVIVWARSSIDLDRETYGGRIGLALASADDEKNPVVMTVVESPERGALLLPDLAMISPSRAVVVYQQKSPKSRGRWDIAAQIVDLSDALRTLNRDAERTAASRDAATGPVAKAEPEESTSTNAEAAGTFERYFNFLGNHPDEAEIFWSPEAQGLAHDDNHWFLLQKDTIWTIHKSCNLAMASPEECGWPYGVALLSDFPALSAYDHIGDGEYYFNSATHSGYLFLPLDGGENSAIAAFRSDPDDLHLEYVSHAQLSLTAGGGGWCAFMPDGTLVTSARNPAITNGYWAHTINWADLEEHGTLVLTDPHFYPFEDATGAPMGITEMQGGVVTGSGETLYVVAGYWTTDGHPALNWGISAFDISGDHKRLIRQSEGFNSTCNPGSFCYEFHTGALAEEPEGATIWSLADGESENVPTSTLHVVMLDNDDPFNDEFDDVYVSHYTERIYVDRRNGGAENGTPANPYNTVSEANVVSWDGCRIDIWAGQYDEAVTFSRRMQLVSRGGTTLIGR